MKNTFQNTTYCFGLRRYSSDAQTGNSSLDRQDVAEKVAKDKGWDYRPELNITQEAVSAYKKHNFADLLALIEKAKSGTLPSGTPVCVIHKIAAAARARWAKVKASGKNSL